MDEAREWPENGETLGSRRISQRLASVRQVPRKVARAEGAAKESRPRKGSEPSLTPAIRQVQHNFDSEASAALAGAWAAECPSVAGAYRVGEPMGQGNASERGRTYAPG